ncbi:hypothetical protein [Bradyrhizobium sp. CB3481]|uniref:esterase/lipase family protein n=1 Tax=Bradyrhizobium sp. CB3481 TaxID=3039158 RepID=UPI0024B239B5|nr:hypothetical protein [Bradyrhizobium sp. CB3481]WFU19455.1 hypothetical protein QA643_14560 [Bradyrhizobium sp. CB3481]
MSSLSPSPAYNLIKVASRLKHICPYFKSVIDRRYRPNSRRELLHVPYDWRRSNRVSARRLAAIVPTWLNAWREKSGNSEAKVVFVVHSMGGLVARHYVECLKGWKMTTTILSFGTPYKGSGNALGFLCNGFAWKIGPVKAFDGTDVLRSFDSVYQLLPTYPFVKEPGQGL